MGGTQIKAEALKFFDYLTFFIKISNLPTLAHPEISSFLSKSPIFLSAVAVIPLTVNKIALSGGFSPL